MFVIYYDQRRKTLSLWLGPNNPCLSQSNLGMTAQGSFRVLWKSPSIAAHSSNLGSSLQQLASVYRLGDPLSPAGRAGAPGLPVLGQLPGGRGWEQGCLAQQPGTQTSRLGLAER